MRGFKNLSINVSVYTIYIQWELNTCPTSHMTVLVVWIILVWVNHHHVRQKRPYCLWPTVSGLLILVLLPSSSWRPEYFIVKRLGQKHQWSGPGNQIAYWDHFYLGFNRGSHINKNEQKGLQSLWHSLLLLMKWPSLLSCKIKKKDLFQTLLELDMNICSIILFQYPPERRIFFQSFLGSF